MGYNFLCFIEFERSANVLSIGEMWLVLGINRLNYRKTLIAAWLNYSWVFDIRRNTKLSIFPLFRRMSAMLYSRHIVVVVLHMPGLARWLTPGRSSCGSTLFVIIFFLMYYLFIFALLLLLLSSSFRLLSLLLLLLAVGCHFLAGEVGCLFGRRDRLPFLAGGRLPFRQDFFPRGGNIACMCGGLQWRSFCVLSLT